MKKFTPQQKARLRKEGYSDEEILEMEMEGEEEMEDEMEDDMEETPGTNANLMRKIPWNEMREVGGMPKKGKK